MHLPGYSCSMAHNSIPNFGVTAIPCKNHSIFGTYPWHLIRRGLGFGCSRRVGSILEAIHQMWAMKKRVVRMQSVKNVYLVIVSEHDPYLKNLPVLHPTREILLRIRIQVQHRSKTFVACNLADVVFDKFH